VAHAVLSQARWFSQARPGDYVLAIGAAPASIPVIGGRLQSIGGLTALCLWGPKYLPDILATARTDRSGAVTGQSGAQSTDELIAEQLRPASSAQRRPAPVWMVAKHRRHVYRASVRYGNAPSQLLDVWRSKDLQTQPAPVLIFLPGGAWVFGSRVLQGHALMAHLAEQGWLCLSVEYRTSPRHRWPRQIADVKAAIAWARANVDKFGGDRHFIVVAGCSAGGHLAALAGLTPNDPMWQTELSDGSDTSVDGVVSIYGCYDWEDRSTPERARFIDFLERVVVKHRLDRHPDMYRAASPLARVNAGAPPFLVIHGTADGIIPVAEARSFVERLRGVSRSPVSYLELPGALHAFDLVDGTRTEAATAAIRVFLNHIHSRRSATAVHQVG
jgi:acetyl esterase/lipase